MVVKSILIDDQANKLLENVLDVNDAVSNTGLIIGTFNESKDSILNVIPTPACTEGGDSKGCDVEWVVNHALQVHDMLVGGIDILGIYCVDLTPSIAKQVLLKIFRTLNDIDYYKKMSFNIDRLIFLVDSATKNINMKTLNYMDTKATLQNCQIDIEAKLFDNEFYRLNSNLNLNSTFKSPNVKSYNLLKKDLYKALNCDELFDSQKFICLIDNNLIEGKNNLSYYLSSLANSSAKEFDATLMENLSFSPKLKSLNSDKSLESIYELNGVCNLAILVHKSMTIDAIKNALVYDLMRSFYARVRLLVEDLDARKDIIGDEELENPDSNEASAIEESYQTPNRIHILMKRDQKSNKNKNAQSFLICDYVFPDETALDISERAKQLFNHEIADIESQIIFVEKLPPGIKRGQDEIDSVSDDGTSILNKQDLNATASVSNQTNGILENSKILIGAVLSLISAATIYYLSIKQEVSNDGKNQ